MKKNFDLAEIIKEAVKEGVLEAFAQMYGIATTDGEVTPETPGAGTDSGGEAEDGDNSGNTSNNNGSNNGSGNNNGGPKEPDPIVGPAGFSLR